MDLRINLFNIKIKGLIIRLLVFGAFVIVAGFIGIPWKIILIIGIALLLISLLGISFGKKRKWKEPELREENYNLTEDEEEAKEQ